MGSGVCGGGALHHCLVKSTSGGKHGPGRYVATLPQPCGSPYDAAMFGPHDGVRAQVPPYRRMMPFLMRGRNESAVYFEQTLDLARTQPWLEAHGAKLFALVLHALASVLHERDRLNRFTAGR